MRFAHILKMVIKMVSRSQSIRVTLYKRYCANEKKNIYIMQILINAMPRLTVLHRKTNDKIIDAKIAIAAVIWQDY